MNSSWLTLIEIDSDGSRLRYTTTADADPMVLAVGYLLDQYMGYRDHVIAGMKVQNLGTSVRVKFEDWVVEARQVQHWEPLDFPEHHELAARLREKFPHRRQVIERAQ